MKGHKVSGDINVICSANGWLQELWRNAALSAFQLQANMSKSDKIWYAYLVHNCVSLRTFWTPLVCTDL